MDILGSHCPNSLPKFIENALALRRRPSVAGVGSNAAAKSNFCSLRLKSLALGVLRARICGAIYNHSNLRPTIRGAADHDSLAANPTGRQSLIWASFPSSLTRVLAALIRGARPASAPTLQRNPKLAMFVQIRGRFGPLAPQPAARSIIVLSLKAAGHQLLTERLSPPHRRDEQRPAGPKAFP